MIAFADIDRRTRMKEFALALAACLLTATSAEAAIVDVTFSSTSGDSLSGSFSYNTDQAPYYIDEQSGDAFAVYYNPSPINIEFNGTPYQITDYSVEVADNNGSFGGGDAFIVNYTHAFVNGDVATYLSSDIELDDPSGKSVSGVAPPTSFATSQGRWGYFAETYTDGRGRMVSSDGGNLAVAFSTVSPTPETPAWISMLLGLCLAGCAAWWKTQRTARRSLKMSFA
jgi:hypothetical protein